MFPIALNISQKLKGRLNYFIMWIFIIRILSCGYTKVFKHFRNVLFHHTMLSKIDFYYMRDTVPTYMY